MRSKNHEGTHTQKKKHLGRSVHHIQGESIRFWTLVRSTKLVNQVRCWTIESDEVVNWMYQYITVLYEKCGAYMCH